MQKSRSTLNTSMCLCEKEAASAIVSGGRAARGRREVYRYPRPHFSRAVMKDLGQMEAHAQRAACVRKKGHK